MPENNELSKIYKEIFRAIRDGKTNLVKEILLEYPDLETHAKVPIKDSGNFSLFNEALSYCAENEELLMLFAKKGIDLTIVSGMSNSGSLLHAAASNGHMNLFNLLIKIPNHQLDLNQKNIIGYTAIELAMNSKKSDEIFLKLYNDERTIKDKDIETYHNLLQIQKFPLIDYCPSKCSNNFFINTLLSNIYSKVISKEVVKNELKLLMEKSDILADIITTTAISLTEHPFPIILVNNLTEFDSTKAENVHGNCDDFYNYVVTSQNSNDFFAKGTFMHELTHKMMVYLFNNNNFSFKFAPFITAKERDSYHLAIKNTLINIAKFYLDEYAINVDIKENDSIYEMGNKLNDANLFHSVILNNLDNFKKIIDQSPNLDINNPKLFALDKPTLMELALSTKNFEIAKILLNLGSNVNQDVLSRAIIHNKLDIFTWLIENKKDINIYQEDEDGYSLINLAKLYNQSDISKLLENYAQQKGFLMDWMDYLSSFVETSNININQSIDNNKDTQNAINTILTTYIYDKRVIDGEFIARIPGIIAMDYHNDQVKAIIAPISNYWLQDISLVSAYKQNHYHLDYCSAISSDDVFIS